LAGQPSRGTPDKVDGVPELKFMLTRTASVLEHVNGGDKVLARSGSAFHLKERGTQGVVSSVLTVYYKLCCCWRAVRL
jgi:hypothetical protein